MMKRILLILMPLLALYGCDGGYDDTEIRKELDDVKSDIDKIPTPPAYCDIRFIPETVDGKAVMVYVKADNGVVEASADLTFRIGTSEVIEAISSGKASVDIEAYYIKTRAYEKVMLPVTDKKVSDNILSVKLSGKELGNAYFTGPVLMNAILIVKYGEQEYCSDYFGIFPMLSYVDNGVNFGPGILIDGLEWAPVNAGSTEEDRYGDYYNYEDALTACPNGWRTPTKGELESLSANVSAFAEHEGMRGRWFSGNNNYSEKNTAVFFPAAGSKGVNSGLVQSLGKSGYYRSSTSDKNNSGESYIPVYNLYLYKEGSSPAVVVAASTPINLYSVRCVKE